MGRCSSHSYLWTSPVGTPHMARMCTNCHQPDPAWLNAMAAALVRATALAVEAEPDRLASAVKKELLSERNVPHGGDCQARKFGSNEAYPHLECTCWQARLLAAL